MIDVEPDGDMDLVSGGLGAGTALNWFENDGSESFTSHSIYAPYTGSFFYLDAGDIDDDGDADIVVCNRDADLIYLFINDGNENFTRSTVTSGVDNPNKVRIRDIDNDGDKDILFSWGTWTGSAWNGGVRWLDNNGSESFTSRVIDSSCEGCMAVDAGDLDGDGDLDVVGGMEITTMAKYTNNGASPPSFTESLAGGYLYPNDLQIEDLDGDGDKDIAVIGNASLSWLENNGTGTFAAHTIATDVASTGMYIEVKDVDGDGDKDLLTASTGDGVSWWRNNGNMTFVEKPLAPPLSNSTRCASVGDVDGDGDQDFVTMWGSTSSLGWFELRNDVSDPTILSLSPADNATSVSPSANLILNFFEPITVQSGNIVIRKISDNSVFETIDVTSAKVTGSGTAHITINPAGTLEQGVGYYVEIDSTAFDDEVSLSYAGISGNTTWNFTTSDTTPPVLQSLSPLDNSSYAPVANNLTLTFNENVAKGSGTIYLKKTSDNSTVESYSVSSSARISVSGTTFIIDPTANLAENTGYYVTVCSGCIKDVSNNSYTGFTGTTDWNFTSGDTSLPTISSLSPTDGASAISYSANLVINFSESVDAEAGANNDIVIKKTSDNSVVETIDAQDSKITGSGTSTITVNPDVVLTELTGYYVQIGADAFDDFSSNSFAGIGDTTTWNFTTEDTTAPSGGSVSYSNGFSNATSVSVTVSDGSDGGSGLDTSSRIIQRRSATLTGGVCGSFGSFSSISLTGSYPSFTDTTITSGHCYQYRYQISDNATNQATYTSGNVLKVDTDGPQVSAGTDKKKKTIFTQNATVSDSLSGIASYQWSKQDGPGTITFGAASEEDTSVSASGEGTYTIRLTVEDNAGNSAYDDFTLIWDGTAPTINNISSNPSDHSVNISWTTDKDASSQIEYGLTSAYGNTTTESDISPRLKNHALVLNNLSSCARYYYRVKSEDEAGNQGVSTRYAFTTTGCEASTISGGNETRAESETGGSVSIDTSTGTASLSLPNNFYNESASIQLNKLNPQSAPNAPENQDLVGDNFFDLLAVTGSGNVVSSFDRPITFTVHYDTETEADYSESSLDVYKYANGSWNKKNCVLDTDANTLTCSLFSFSTYGVFGQPISEEESEENSDQTPVVAVGPRKTISLSKNESVSLKSKKVIFRGKNDSLNPGDTVKIFKNGKFIGSKRINKNKKWRFQKKQIKNTTSNYFFVYLRKKTKEELSRTSEYQILIDGDSPKITNLSKSIKTERGGFITWTASDNDGIKYHQVQFQGRKYNLNESRFQIPPQARRGISRIIIKSFDRAENCVTRKIMAKIK